MPQKHARPINLQPDDVHYFGSIQALGETVQVQFTAPARAGEQDIDAALMTQLEDEIWTTHRIVNSPFRNAKGILSAEYTGTAHLLRRRVSARFVVPFSCSDTEFRAAFLQALRSVAKVRLWKVGAEAAVPA